MRNNIPNRVYNELAMLARRYGIDEIYLFGSRATGTNSPRSDIDIAVRGGDFEAFYVATMEEIHSLLMFDIVDLEKAISSDLKAEIAKDGVKIYEKAG